VGLYDGGGGGNKQKGGGTLVKVCPTDMRKKGGGILVGIRGRFQEARSLHKVVNGGTTGGLFLSEPRMVLGSPEKMWGGF